MRKPHTCIPSEEMMMKVKRAVESIRNKESKDVKCPYCNHTAFVVYLGATGFVENKCRKCKRSVVVDLVSMRRIKHHQSN